MICPQCDTDNPEGARFCMGCATGLGLVCAECGSKLPQGARYCVNCAALAPAPAPASGPEPPKARQDNLAERLRRLVPKEYAERLLATRGQVTPERRTVTMLFSDVKGSTAMAEDLDPDC